MLKGSFFFFLRHFFERNARRCKVVLMYTSLFHLFASFFLVLHRKLYSALLTFSFSLSLSLSCKSADGSKSLPIIIEACGFCRYRGKKKNRGETRTL